MLAPTTLFLLASSSCFTQSIGSFFITKTYHGFSPTTLYRRKTWNSSCSSCSSYSSSSSTTTSSSWSLASSPMISSMVSLTAIKGDVVEPTTTETFHNGNANGKIKEALQKMRGVSVSIEYDPALPPPPPLSPTLTATLTATPTPSSNTMELELLSQDLRKAKVSSIFTSDIHAIQIFANEQQSAKGNFPPPCPIVYNGNKDHIQDAIQAGASAIVVKGDDTMVTMVDNIHEIIHRCHQQEVDVICQIENKYQLQNAIDAGYQYSFLIKLNDAHSVEKDNDSKEEGKENECLETLLTIIPKDAIVIYSLPSMQTNSNEISKGKQIVDFAKSLSSTSTDATTPTTTTINGLLFEKACVGDEEDLKYTNFVVNGVTKKASSTFAMTGLTGSTNGHFGTSDHVSIEDAKWKRLNSDSTST